MKSISPGTWLKRCVSQSAFACSMRCLADETKFGHPIDVISTDHQPATEAIVVDQRACVEMGDRGESAVRMRASIKPAARRAIPGTAIEEHAWPELPAPAGQQQLARRETISQNVQTRCDEERRVRGHVGAAGRDAA